jgi:hypothetical protein
VTRPRRLLLGLLVAVGLGTAVWMAASVFTPIVKVSDISRIRGR